MKKGIFFTGLMIMLLTISCNRDTVPLWSFIFPAEELLKGGTLILDMAGEPITTIWKE